ncbi:MAG: hypothetical protein COX41_07190 [Candidatus Omnitrophica bacterium CG23_combo_of_CG06-09_8_20_14_all_41_10]|uniref:Uncharacterized protein n=1 Tax=Candidatus Sherwoodlollariibacterium unditelluris TaxID=1974757 RepID=A0A2G9YIT8_9BACT|nr:MAG: hypothetical protein COX41_07190 [Candidatus Omnitrophica bacterium CG23_combo_of_CG06-09_8_20_14_all_41_10]
MIEIKRSVKKLLKHVFSAWAIPFLLLQIVFGVFAALPFLPEPFQIKKAEAATTAAISITITLDTTAPSAAITYSDADGIVKAGDSLTITATFNEAMADSPLPQIAISGANTLAATNMTKSSTTVYTYTHTVASDISCHEYD